MQTIVTVLVAFVREFALSRATLQLEAEHDGLPIVRSVVTLDGLKISI